MLDEKDLQALAQLMAQQKQDIINEVKVLLEADIHPKFNLLADGLAAAKEKHKALPEPDLMDKMQE